MLYHVPTYVFEEKPELSLQLQFYVYCDNNFDTAKHEMTENSMGIFTDIIINNSTCHLCFYFITIIRCY